MRREVPPSQVSDFTTFPPLPHPYSGVRTAEKTTFGHVSKDGLWAWVAKDSMLEVFSTRTQERCSSWCFGAVLKITTCTISAITELCSSSINYPCLLVGIDKEAEGSLLCMFNVKTSKVVKVIELPYKITSLEVVSGEGGASIETNPLSSVLRCMFGLLAVGTEYGHVDFLDLCLDEENYSNENAPNKVTFVTKTTSNIPGRREVCLPRGQHLCLSLNDGCASYSVFEYRGSSSTLGSFPSDEVYVSALKYMRSLTVLAVGFNFGGIQLWNMQKLTIQQTLSIHANQLPVVQFAFQEPENDPRNVCYLWGITGFHQGENFRPTSVSVATLYSLSYYKKTWLNGFGYLYQDFQGCCRKFEYVLSNDPFSPLSYSKSICSRLVACHVVPPTDGLYRLDADDNLQTEELNISEDLSTCVMAWEVWPAVGDSLSSCYLVLFDINQWYQAQMPSMLRYDSGELCSFLGVFSLQAVTSKMNAESLLDIYVVPHSLTKFKCLTVAEEFFYPSSLAFKTWCISVGGSVHASYLGTQRQLLSEMNQAGPNCLIDPKELYNCCLVSGLLSHIQENLPAKHVNVVSQREALLTLALEQNMCFFLHSCIQKWSTGEFMHMGCSVKVLLEWAWKRVTQIKAAVDKLCQPLFNCSGQGIDKSTIQSLQSYENQLKRLINVMISFQTLSGPKTEQGKRELALRIEVVQSIAVYLHVLIWLYDSHLLPEHSEGEEYGEDEVAYPVSRLSRTYSCRRMELQKLHSSIAPTDILLVDGLVTEMGSDLANLWETKGGSGIYPPPSLYAAVGSYLLDGVSRVHKHMLLYYVILDMEAFLSDRQTHLLDKLAKFSQSFNISPSLTKLTQAFWLLDHQDFEAAMSTLLDPIVLSEDIVPWCHTRILKSFLYQGHQQKALNYITQRKPPQNSAEDIKMHLSILLANGFIYEAFHYQRQHQLEANVEDLLNHLFYSCQQIHSLDALLQFPLNATEKAALVEFLQNCSEPRAQELLVMYYLLNSCPLEAASLNEKLISELMEHSSKSQERAKIRNSLVTGYLNTLPEEQKMLAQEIKQMAAATTNHVEAKFEPLSTTLTTRSLTFQSYSDLLSNVLAKINSISAASACAPQTPFKLNSMAHAPSVPFLGTPVAPQSSKKLKTPTNVIFATPVPKRPLSRASEVYEFASPAKRPRFLENMSFRGADSEKRRSTSHLSADVLSLLQTPPIFRKSPQFRSSFSRDGLSSITPHSILKMRRSLSPLSKGIPSTKSSSASSKDGETSEDEAVICDDRIEEKKQTLPGNDDIQSKHLRFQDSTPPHSVPVSKWLHRKNLPSHRNDIKFSPPTERSFKASPRRPLRDLDLSGSSASSDVFMAARESLSPPVSPSVIRNDHLNTSKDYGRTIVEKSVDESRHSVSQDPLALDNIMPKTPNLQAVLSDVFINNNNLEMTPSTSDEKLFTEEIEVDDANEDRDFAIEYEDYKENNPCTGEISLTPETTPPSSPVREEYAENFTLQLSDTDQESDADLKKPVTESSPLKAGVSFVKINVTEPRSKPNSSQQANQMPADIHSVCVPEEELYVISEQSIIEDELLLTNEAGGDLDSPVLITEEKNELYCVEGEVENYQEVSQTEDECSTVSDLSDSKGDLLHQDVTIVAEIPSVVEEDSVHENVDTSEQNVCVLDTELSIGEKERESFEHSDCTVVEKEEIVHMVTKKNCSTSDTLNFVVETPLVECDEDVEERSVIEVEEENRKLKDSHPISEPSHSLKQPVNYSDDDLEEDSFVSLEDKEMYQQEDRHMDTLEESMQMSESCGVKKRDASTPEKSIPMKAMEVSGKSDRESLPSPIKSHAEEPVSPASSDSYPYRGTRSRSKSKSGSPKATTRRPMCEVFSPKELPEYSITKVKPQEKKTRSSGSQENTPSGLPKTKGTHVAATKSRQVRSEKKSGPKDKSVSDLPQDQETPVSSTKLRRRPKQGSKSKRTSQPQFSFADPNVSHDPEILEALASPSETPVPSFVFSPPLTRARMRQKKFNDTLNSSYMSAASEFSFTTRGRKLPEDPLLLDSSSFMPDDSIISTSSEVPTSHSAKKKTVSKKKKSLSHSELPVSQSIINFLSPLESEPGSSLRNSRHSSTARHSMVLRKAKIKRKSVRLW